MSPDDRDERLGELFARAKNLPPSEQGQFLEQECDDDELRSDLQNLLVAHRSAPKSDFANPILPGNEGTDSDVGQIGRIRAGKYIGPYKILQRLGEGGMGTVFVAEQTEPVERRVALKLIKLGMDSEEVVARFEAERQALAMMDHPNIAKVLDGGSTEFGQPYFVMELVKGVPVTEYCDERKLSTRSRLELCVSICNAVAHAHQKGIIHRDIKPSNILVTEFDGRPVPKIIDFGIAKATTQKLTDKTLFTAYGQIVGTVDYMSPKQQS